MAQNLTRRGAVYYARIAVPKKLQDLRKQLGLDGPKEIWKSLETRDLAVAKRARPRALESIYRAFEEEESRLLGEGARPVSSLVVPDEHDFQRAVWEFIDGENRRDEQSRTARPTRAEIERRVELTRKAFRANPSKGELDMWVRPGGLSELGAFVDGAELDAERRQILVEELRAHLAENNFVLIDWAVESLIRRNRWHVERDSLKYRELSRHLMRGWIRALETSFQRDRGEYLEGAVTPMPASKVPSAAEAGQGKPKKGEGLRDYLDAYLREQKQHVKVNALKDARATIRQFLECNGDRVVTAYTRADMAHFKRMLAKAPARVEKLYPGIPLPKAVERNRKDGHPLLKSNSIRNKLSTLAAFGSWLESNVPGVDAQNFKTTLPPKRDAERMEPFSPEEVRQILNAKSFTGCESERNQLKEGDYKIRDWRFWLPLVAAFTGARLNEITQLKVADIENVAGIWTFRITDSGVGQSLKNENSRRLVPVHPHLIELGLLGYRDMAVTNRHEDLFHQIPLDGDGRRSHHAGKWFRKFLQRIGIKNEGDLGGSHRWRHTLPDALRAAGVDDYQIAHVLGHRIDVAKMTAHYGRDVTMTLEQKRTLLAKASYPSVDFSLLT